MCLIVLCFFFKLKAAYDMRISDWSSDVCSSDLVRHRLLPSLAARRVRTPFQVVDRFLIDRDQSNASACFDRHVAQSHSAFHGQGANRATAKLDGVAGAACRADAADHVQDQVLVRYARSSEAHTSELQSQMLSSYAVSCLKTQ